MDRTLKIGTRGSQLALWQANHIKDRLAAIGVAAELKVIRTQGDIVQHLRLDKLEGKGFFTKELEEELLDGRIDLAVHSHKDLPTVHPPGLTIATVSEREDPSEVLVIRKEAVDIRKRFSLRENATVGTSSNRRKAQLLSLRPDLAFADLRGNLHTRIQKLRDKNYDAIMLAKAGILRMKMNLSDFILTEIPPTEIVPAPAQGVLAVQIREADTELSNVLQRIHDREAADAIAVERAVLNRFDAGCHAPLGCYCRRAENGRYESWTSVAATAEDFPDRLYLQSGTTAGMAEKIFDRFRPERKLPKSVFISRYLAEDSYLRRYLAKHDVRLEARPLIKTIPTGTKPMASDLERADWIFFNSPNAILHFSKQGIRIPERVKLAVLGRGSEDALRRHGRVADFSGDRFGIRMDDIAREFAKLADGKTVLVPRAKDSLLSIQKALTPATSLIDLAVYETVPDENPKKTNAEVLIFTSPSNARAYFGKNGIGLSQKIIGIGISTAKTVNAMGFSCTLPFSPDEIGLAEALFS